MHNLKNIPKNLFDFKFFSNELAAFILSLTIAVGAGNLVRAQTPDNVPAELKDALEQIEAAANRHDLEGVMKFYTSNFTNSDGLSYSTLSQALTKTWKTYPELNYTTKLESWERKGNEIVAVTLTELQGSQNVKGRLVRLNSTVRSRQHFAGGKIVKQDVLAETTKILSGNNPPLVEINSPEKVSKGEQFDFDIIVTEPLENDVLLGNLIEEPVMGDRYLNPTTIDLKLLPAGGIFQVVKAPSLPENLWFSAILVRGDGIVQITKRIRVE